MDNSVPTVPGFKASAIKAGFKKDDSLDLALIYSEKDSTAAGVFTTNKVKAGPVVITKEHILGGKARAIIANAGNANACNGEKGIDDARLSAELVAGRLGIPIESVLVASTGVIGKPLETELIEQALPALVKDLSPKGLIRAARAIMTTDSFPKLSVCNGKVSGGSYRIAGIAKGAGMIMPNMATMLCFILSDICIDAHSLKRALLSSVERTFNRISVDGDTSTNDMVLMMASGAAGNKVISETDYGNFVEELTKLMDDLATMVVRDGEGATKLVHVIVEGAGSPSDAINAARTVSNSSLVKTAFFGQDPNWGRIMAALGRSGIVLEENRVDIWINDTHIVSMGTGMGVDQEKKASDIMAAEEFTLKIDLHQGTYSDKILTCDLTHEYVSINADYRT